MSDAEGNKGLVKLFVFFGVLVLAILLWPKRVPEPEPSKSSPVVTNPDGGGGVPQAIVAARGLPAAPSWSNHYPSPADPAAPPAPKTLWEKRLARSEQVLSNYLESTKYPPHVSLARTQPGMSKPLGTDTTTRVPLRRKDGKATKAKLSLYQDRVYVSGDETVVLRLSAADDNGPVALTVKAVRAQAPSIAPEPKPSPVSVSFSDDGSGVLTANFQPARNGFGSYRGDIEIIADLLAGPEDGDGNWLVVYTPTIPAKFNGKFREVFQDGSLELYVGVTVAIAGHYVINLRVDTSKDATATPSPKIALLTEQMKNSDFRVRVSASIALGSSADPQAVAPLCGCFHSPSEIEAVRSACSAALLKLQQPGSRECLDAPSGANPNWFALLTFNGDLPKGEQEAKFLLFGKMVRDAKAVSPFHLRDMDGFLLYEKSSPDRDLMANLVGVFYSTKAYALDSFSETIWTSADKEKTVAEFTKDVDTAKKHVADESSGKVPEEKLPEDH